MSMEIGELNARPVSHASHIWDSGSLTGFVKYLG